MKKRRMSIVTFFFMVLSLILMGGLERNAEAATKATLSHKTVRIKEGDDCDIYIKNCKKNARYTYAVSNKNIIGVFHSDYLPQQNSIQLSIKPTKYKGSARLTVYEVIGNKTSKVGTCTFKNSMDVSDAYSISLAFNKFTVAKGCKFNLEKNMFDADIPETAVYQSSNPSVASITKNGIVTTKKRGKTIITIKTKDESEKIELTVLNKKLESKYAKIVSGVNNLMKKKITKSNYMSSYKQFLSLYKADFGTVDDDEGASQFEDGDIKVPYYYRLGEVDNKLMAYLEKNKNVTLKNSCLDVSKVSVDSASQSIKIDLRKKLTREDFMLINLDEMYKCHMNDKAGKVDHRVSVYDSDGWVNYIDLSIKKGKKTLYGKLESGNFEFEKGEKYYICLENVSRYSTKERGTEAWYCVQAK